MKRIIQYVILTAGIVGIIGVLFLFFELISFAGVFDKKYTREELTRNFIDHQREFSDVVNLFKKNIPQNNTYDIVFWQKGKKNVSLLLRHKVIDPKNKNLEISEVSVDSPKLDSALRILGWSKDYLVNLRNMLEKTECNYIRNADLSDSIVDLGPYQSSWGSFNYRVWDRPIIDSMATIHGTPLGNDNFGIKVTLIYLSAL